MKQADRHHQVQFFDEVYQSGTREPVAYFYDVLQSSLRRFQSLLLSHAPGRMVLELGTGAGDCSLFLGRHGARVVGIDVSPVAIELATKRARAEGLNEVTFSLMDAEWTEFEDDAFDLVCGAGILHHLNLPAAIAELSRVLKPQGKAIFREPMGQNPAINAFRRLTPHLRSPGEHPLTMSNLLAIKRAFRRSDCRFFHFLSVPFVPLAKRPGLSYFVQALDRFDSLLLERIPWAGRFAWQVVLLLENPKKPGASAIGSGAGVSPEQRQRFP